MDKKVLIIDDDEGIRDALQAILESSGYQVELADNEKKLLASRKKPSLILLDLFLSGRNGKKIAKNLKSRSDTKDIPIIILSAHPNASRELEGIKVDGFLAKPFEVDDLLEKVGKYCTPS